MRSFFSYRFAIDIDRPDLLSGWCFHRFRKHPPLTLQLWQSNRLLAEVTADRKREDLLSLGLHPTGLCGFEFVIGHHDQLPHGQRVIKEKTTGTIITTLDQKRKLSLSGMSGGMRQLLQSLGQRLRPSHHPAILFMHIPKTAGTSFNTMARAWLSHRKVISHIEAQDTALYPRFTRAFRFISGHLYFGVFKKHFDLTTHPLYTIVREPYGQLHSHLKWARITPNDQPDNSPKYSNQAIQAIGRQVGNTDFSDPDSIDGFVANIQHLGAPFFDNMQVRHFLDDHVDIVTDNHLLIAQKNCERFTHIGRTENYSEFLHRFAYLNSLKRPETAPRLNRSQSTPLFDLEDAVVRQQLFPLVQYDLQLYRFIQKRFG